jgi:beta-glucuronidase
MKRKIMYNTFKPFRYRVIYLLILITVISSTAQNIEDLLTNIAGRHITSLNGNWQVIIDPYEAGY